MNKRSRIVFGSHHLEFSSYWKGTGVHRIIVLDTSVLLKIAKKEAQARLVSEELKRQGFSLFFPASALFEVGLGPHGKVDPGEHLLWTSIFTQNPNYSGPDYETTKIAQFIEKFGSKSFQGQLTFINPDMHNWYACKYFISELLNNPAKNHPGNPRELFHDALIFSIARNLFGSVWTENQSDFQLLARIEGWRKTSHEPLPIFSTAYLSRLL